MKNRILPEEVREAFIRFELKPERGNYFLKGNRACGMGAIALHRNLYKEDRFLRSKLVNIFGEDYHNGFVYGFDESCTPEEDWKEDTHLGYCDGISAWEAVEHLVN